MNRALVTALMLAVAVALWMASGVWAERGTETTPAGTAREKPRPVAVSVRRFDARPLVLTRSWQGEVVPARAVTLRLQLSGQIAEVARRKGEQVKAGELILRLDPADRMARKAQAEAEVALRRETLKATRALFKRGLVSDTRLKEDEAALAAAEAALRQIEQALADTELRAPFAGLISRLDAEPGEVVLAGEAVGRLIGISPVRVRFGIPQQEVAKVKVGDPVRVRLADGGELQGALSWIAGEASSAVRTFEAEADIPTAQPVRLGQSATVEVSLGERRAHKISGALLNLAADGSLYVKGVDAGRVVRHDVRLIQADRDGYWVEGLPPAADLIVIGQGFVSPGDPVEVRRLEEGAPAA